MKDVLRVCNSSVLVLYALTCRAAPKPGAMPHTPAANTSAFLQVSSPEMSGDRPYRSARAFCAATSPIKANH
jgi:hypothetical protein